MSRERIARHADMAEASANVAIGLAINWMLLAVVYGRPLTATGVSAAAFVLTFLRSYALRRLFRRMVPQ